MFATEMNRMRKIQNAVTLSLTAMFCLFTPSSAFAITPTTLTPTSVNFGNVVIHESSAIKLVTLKNNQSVALNIASIVLSPGSPYAIDPSTTCPSSGSLAPSGTPGASCTIGLTLTPAALGTQPAGSVTITTNASNSPQTLTLSGKGIAPVAISPTSLKLTFAAQLEGTTSAGQTVKVSNQQNIPLNALEGSFQNFSGAQAYVAYAESLAAVSYINDSYGMSDIQRILQLLSQGSSTEAALRATIHSDYGQFESDLAKYLADKYGQ